MASKNRKKSAFVPRLLVHATIAGVVPACALAAVQGCSSSSNAPQDSGFLGVAAVAYPAYESGVPDTKSDSTSDAPSEAGDSESGGADTFFAVAYPAYETGPG